MFAKPQAQHEWFNDFLGEWEFTHECVMGPGQPPNLSTGKLSARTLGGLWLLMDCSGGTPGTDAWTSQFTLGFDPAKDRFVGTFVASMMTHLWIYEGELDAGGQQLIMNVDGPTFDGSGMARYQDCYEKISRDHWILRSRLQGADGQWQQFLEGHHRRVG